MKKENLEQLKSVIQETNPEIMDIPIDSDAVGIRVEVSTPRLYWRRQPENATEAVAREQLENRVKYKLEKRAIELEKEFIYGRPIRLADILLAIDKADRHDPPAWWKRTSDIMGVVVADMPGLLFFICSNWNLKDDNLDNQSDECKEFLFNLLVEGK